MVFFCELSRQILIMYSIILRTTGGRVIALPGLSAFGEELSLEMATTRNCFYELGITPVIYFYNILKDM